MSELARLRWQCRRGTRELDILLGNYLEHHYLNADREEQRYFVDLLALEDTKLIAYLLGDKSPDSKEMASLVNKIREHIQT